MCSAFEARDFNKAIEKMPGGICEVSTYHIKIEVNVKYIHCFHEILQSWPKKFVLGCVIPPAGTVARSCNLGLTFCITF